MFRSALLKVTSALVAVFALCAAAAAADVRESREASGFTGVALSAPIRVEITQGDRDSVVLEGDPQTLAELETTVVDRVLRIRLKPGLRINWNRKARALVTARSVEKIAVAGSGDVVAPGLRSNALNISIAGSGDVTVGGTAATLSTSIAGSGDLKAAKLEARTVSVSIAGSGDATVWARESLSVSIMGSGDVRYLGDPAVTRTILGSGEVKRLAQAPS